MDDAGRTRNQARAREDGSGDDGAARVEKVCRQVPLPLPVHDQEVGHEARQQERRQKEERQVADARQLYLQHAEQRQIGRQRAVKDQPPRPQSEEQVESRRWAPPPQPTPKPSGLAGRHVRLWTAPAARANAP